MPVALLSFTTSVQQLRKHIVYTLKRLSMDPRGEPFRQEFKDLREEWRQLQMQEFDLKDAITESGVGIFSWDLLLNAFTDSVDEATEDDPQIRELLFQGKPVYVFKRPIGGAQLRAMTLWGGTLASDAAKPALQEKAPELTALVTKAKEAEAQLDEDRRKLKEFYTAGARMQFIKKLNIARGKVYRHFSQLVTEHPELKLDRRYPYSFFFRRDGEGALELEDEISLIQEEIEEKRGDLAVLEVRLQELLQQKEAQDREAREAEAREARIAEIKQELAELEAKSRKKKR